MTLIRAAQSIKYHKLQSDKVKCVMKRTEALQRSAGLQNVFSTCLFGTESNKRFIMLYPPPSSQNIRVLFVCLTSAQNPIESHPSTSCECSPKDSDIHVLNPCVLNLPWTWIMFAVWLLWPSHAALKFTFYWHSFFRVFSRTCLIYLIQHDYITFFALPLQKV